jgi:hypothetical protein
LAGKFWSRATSRWQQNPGFVAAAAAGSIGLLLTIVLGLQGAIRLLDDTSRTDEVVDDSLPSSSDDSSDEWGDDWRRQLTEPMEDSGDTMRSSSSAALLADLRHDSDLEDKDSADDALPQTATTSLATIEKRDPFEMDDDSDAGDRPERIQPRRYHPLNENPLADDSPADGQAPPRRAVQLPIDVDDDSETTDGDAQSDPAKIAGDFLADKSTPPKSATGPSFGDDPPDAGDGDASDEYSKPSAAIANDRRSLSPGWKNQPSKPFTPADAPPSVAQQSQAVETVIFATPGTSAASSINRADSAASEARPARLVLEISGPGSARIGQSCNFEIRVKNPGLAAVRNITLSVELPAELVHEVAPSLEQKVATVGPGQTYRALVRTRVKSSGKATLTADVAIDDRPDAQTTATVEISQPTRLSSSRPPRR